MERRKESLFNLKPYVFEDRKIAIEELQKTIPMVKDKNTRACLETLNKIVAANDYIQSNERFQERRDEPSRIKSILLKLLGEK